jgi:uncharacterized membrane protein SpoIIM required for sporulation
VDVDAFVAAHRGEWERLGELVARRRYTGAEADELVDLYRRTTTHLSVVRSSAPDPALVTRLSSLVARARSAVVGTQAWSWRTPLRFVTVAFPAALATTWRWWATTAAIALVLVIVTGVWVAGNPDVQAAVVPPDEVRQLVERDFAEYYSTDPAGSFAAKVWTNNAWVAALCLVAGVLLVPVVVVLAVNVVNVAAIGGIMAAHGRLDLFLGLITPHGLLELTAVFVAAGAGLRLGWAWIDPGPRRRADALAVEGRTTVGMALGVALLLLVSGVIEAFVTPSGLPTWARVGIGVLAEAGFVAYVLLGFRRLRQGEGGDLARDDPADLVPVAG